MIRASSGPTTRCGATPPCCRRSAGCWWPLRPTTRARGCSTATSPGTSRRASAPSSSRRPTTSRPSWTSTSSRTTARPGANTTPRILSRRSIRGCSRFDSFASSFSFPICILYHYSSCRFRVMLPTMYLYLLLLPSKGLRRSGEKGGIGIWYTHCCRSHLPTKVVLLFFFFFFFFYIFFFLYFIKFFFFFFFFFFGEREKEGKIQGDEQPTAALYY